MNTTRRSLLTGGAVLAANAASSATAAEPDRAQDQSVCSNRQTSESFRTSAVFVPGYYPSKAHVAGRKVKAHPDIAKGIKPSDRHVRLLSRIGMDGSVRQALLPAAAHDVEIAPDGSIGLLCGFAQGGHVAFDPETLDVVGRGQTIKKGWNGGGHAAFLPDSKTVLVSERAPRQSLRYKIESHYGRVTIREPESMKILESYSTHGVDPHDIQLVEDGKYLVVANYGSVIDKATGKFGTPRRVVEASVTVLEIASGKLVDKRLTGARDTELRHLAAASRQDIFTIQARNGNDDAGARQDIDQAVAYEADITTQSGNAYLSAATLKFSNGSDAPIAMGGPEATKLMRHGLSIEYDALHDQVIASYPSTHRVMTFDAASGDILKIIDTAAIGLRYPCGVTLLPDGQHYAVTGYWENLFVFERRTHRLVRELCLYPVFFGHSHICAA